MLVTLTRIARTEPSKHSTHCSACGHPAVTVCATTGKCWTCTFPR